MVEELQVKIGADASDFVDETRKASRAFDKFTESVEGSADEVAKASTGARDAFGRFVKSTETGAAKSKKVTSAFDRLSAAAKRGASRVRDLAKRLGEVGVKALVAGFRGLTRIISSVTKAALTLGAALAGIGAAAAVSFAKFQTEFAQVRTLVEESLVDVEGLEDGVRDLAVAFGVDVIEATRAAYQAISAGREPGEVLKFLEATFKGAAAGAAETSEAVDLFTTVLNSFGAAAGTTENVAKILFATVKAGKTTVTELAASFGQVAPVAASAGVSLEETAAAVATLTASGLNTAEAVTALKATLVGILKPSEAAAVALAEIGVSAESLSKVGLEDAITRVRDAIASGNTKLVEFFPNVRALVGVATLAGEGFDKFRSSIDATTNSAGAAGEAFAKVAETTGFAFGQLRRTVEDTFLQVGKLIDPFVARGINAFKTFAESARSELEGLGDVLTKRFTPAVENAFTTLENSASKSGDLASQALAKIADGFDFVAKQIRRAAPAIAGLVATFDTLVDAVRVAANAIRTVLGGALTAISSAVTGFIGLASELARGLDLEVTESLVAAKIAAAEFTAELAKETKGAFEDTIEAAKDFADVAEVFDDTEKAVTRFGLSVGRAAKGVRELNEEVKQTRDATQALQEQDERIESLLDKIDNLGKKSEEAAAGQKKLGDETKETTEALGELDEAAGTGGFTDRIVGGLEETERGAAAATDAIEKLAAATVAAAEEVVALERASSGLGFGSGRRSGGETQQGVNERFSGFGFGIQSGRAVGRVNVGAGVFHDGGPVLQTGRADVVADEFVLSQRGLSDLGRTFAGMLNRGGSESIVNQTNNFQVNSVSPDGSGEDAINELAFKLGPALSRAGRLAAARSPVT